MPTLAVFQLYHGILSVLGVTTVSRLIKNNQAFHSIFGHMTFQVKHEISLDKKKKNIHMVDYHWTKKTNK